MDEICGVGRKFMAFLNTKVGRHDTSIRIFCKGVCTLCSRRDLTVSIYLSRTFNKLCADIAM